MKSTSKPTLTWTPPRPFTLTPVALLAGLALGGCQLVYGSGDEPLSNPAAFDDQTPQDGPGDSSQPQVFQGCDHVTSESLWCLTKEINGLEVVGLDSGATCAVGIDWAPPDASLAVVGSHAYTCNLGSPSLDRVSLVTGEQDSIPNVSCMALAPYRGGLLVLRDLWTTALDWYQDDDAVAAGQPTETFTVPGIWGSRIFAVDDTLYSAWHSTDVVDTFSLRTGESTGAIVLDGYDGWIFGMHVDEQGRLYILDEDANVRVFDVESGASLGAIRISGQWGFREGLSCFSS